MKGSTAVGGFDAKSYLLFATVGMGALAVLSLMMSDVLGVVVGAALCAALYFGGMKKLEMGDVATARTTAIVAGIIAGIIGLAALLVAKSFLGILDILVAIPAIMAWHQLEGGQ